MLIDDFYLVSRQSQPDVIDYLHRLLRDTDVYLKVATIRHRTTLQQTIGVELAQDVEEINLDRTLEDLEQTQAFLSRMLSSMGEKAGIPDITGRGPAVCTRARAHSTIDGFQVDSRH